MRREAFRAGVSVLASRQFRPQQPTRNQASAHRAEALTTAEQVTALGDALSMPMRFEEISPQTAREEAIASGWPPDLLAAPLQWRFIRASTDHHDR